MSFPDEDFCHGRALQCCPYHNDSYKSRGPRLRAPEKLSDGSQFAGAEEAGDADGVRLQQKLQ